MAIGDLDEQSKSSRKYHQDNNPKLPLHFLAEEVGEEAAAEFQAADDEHIDLKAIPIVVNRILNGVIESIVAGLCKAEYDEWK